MRKSLFFMVLRAPGTQYLGTRCHNSRNHHSETLCSDLQYGLSASKPSMHREGWDAGLVSWIHLSPVSIINIVMVLFVCVVQPAESLYAKLIILLECVLCSLWFNHVKSRRNMGLIRVDALFVGFTHVPHIFAPWKLGPMRPLWKPQ